MNKLSGIKSLNRLLPYIMITLAAMALMFLFMYMQKPDPVTTTVLVSAISAFLGVALTMGVTQMQLDNQTKKETDENERKKLVDEIALLNNKIKEIETAKNAEIEEAKRHQKTETEKELTKESIIFEQRLKVYQDYLQTLLDVVEDGQLEDSERLKLQFQTSLIAMHTSSQHIHDISNSVKDIIIETCGKKGHMILEPLFDLVYVFRDELYKGDDKDASEYRNKLDHTIANFRSAFMDEDSQIEEVSKVSGNSLWDDKVHVWNNRGWLLDVGKGGEWFVMKRGDGRPGKISGGFRNDKAFIQAEILPGDADFANYLKWNLPEGVDESHRRWGLWETSGNDMMRSIQPGNLLQTLRENDQLSGFVASTIDYLIQRQDESVRLSLVRQELLEVLNMDLKAWSWPKLWEFKTLFSDHDTHDDKEGVIFLDLYENGSETQLILGNRKDPLKLSDTRKRIGIEDKVEFPDTGNQRILLHSFEENVGYKDIARVMYDWMERIKKRDPESGVTETASPAV